MRAILEGVCRCGLALAMFAGFSLSPAVAYKVAAQDAPPAASAPAATQPQERPRETTYDFDDDLVSGDLVRPDGEQLVVRRKGRRASLIRVREHFIPEMLKSVEDL